MELDVKLWLWALPSKVVCYRMVSAGSCSWNDSGFLVLNELNFLNFFFMGKRMLMYSEKAMAPHSSTLAWKIPWTEKPGRLQSVGSLRVGYD